MSKASNSKRNKKRKKNKIYTSSRSKPDMKQRKNKSDKYDLCNICKQHSELEYDHVPPKSTRHIIMNESNYLKDKNFDLDYCGNVDKNVQALQFKNVCNPCNQISKKYVNNFNNMIEQLLTYLNYNCYKQPALVTINPLKVFKQILYMFMVINDDIKHAYYHKPFYQLFEDTNQTNVNGFNYFLRCARFYMAFNTTTNGNLIYHSDQIAMKKITTKPATNGSQQNNASVRVDFKPFAQATELGACENIILFSPFLFKMVIRPDIVKNFNTDNLLDITDWITYENKDITLSLNLKEHNVEFPPKSYKSTLIECREV